MSEDWAAYFGEYRRNMDLVKRGITNSYLDEDGVLVVETIEEPPAFEVRGVEKVDPATFVRSPKAIYERVVALDWTIYSIVRSTLWYFDHFQKGTGKLNEKTGIQVMAGDLTKPAHEETRTVMTVASTKWKCGFVATWSGGSFTDVVMHDVPVGFPVPLMHVVRGLNDRGEGVSVKLNEGDSLIVHKLWTDKFGALTDWLDEWLEIINPSEVTE